MLLGTGGLFGETANLAKEMGLGDRVVLPGATRFPGPFYELADLFALSSDYEGLGNVLIEALACGLPVVSTDCRSGPREILDNGRYGALTPVGDADALARAMLDSSEQGSRPGRPETPGSGFFAGNRRRKVPPDHVSRRTWRAPEARNRMCGIAGFLRPGDRRGLGDDVRSMTDALAHRGPDGEGAWTDCGAGVALGHRRLAIVELSERGAQPMHSACGRFVLTYNGEIYNHLDLRAELDARGSRPWRGNSDTETLLEGFAAWGVEATLERAVGMFAFGLWDRRDRRLTLARDRFGEKPLYYGWLGRGQATAFAFGSELKALRAHKAFDNAVNRDVVALFLRFCYVPAPYSIYDDIFKLAPATILTLDAGAVPSRQIETRSYWSYGQAAAKGRPTRARRTGGP